MDGVGNQINGGVIVKKGKMIGVVALVMCLLTGCVDYMPEMTQEQSDLIAEYSADLLLKYSPNYEYRLADEELIVEESTEWMSEESSIVTEETATVEPEADKTETIHVETDVEEEMESEEIQETTEPIELPSITEIDLAQIFELEGVEFVYDSFEICASYPNKPESSGFTVSATEDNALLIVHFTLENVSSDDVQCDLFDAGVDISLDVNDSGMKPLMNTLLTNDITTFIEKMDGSEKQDVVAVLEMKAGEEVESLAMEISGKDVSQKIKIK